MQANLNMTKNRIRITLPTHPLVTQKLGAFILNLFPFVSLQLCLSVQVLYRLCQGLTGYLKGSGLFSCQQIYCTVYTVYLCIYLYYSVRGQRCVLAVVFVTNTIFLVFPVCVLYHWRSTFIFCHGIASVQYMQAFLVLASFLLYNMSICLFSVMFLLLTFFGR